MPMFDYLRCEVEVPGPARPIYQTKDLGCDMSIHTIRCDGRLMEEQRESRFTGALNFYAYEAKFGWVEYVALFRGGVLLPPIELVEFSPVEDTPDA